ncbi:hypothetical protein FRC18_008554 [Serendipita sp. 400]|nr:hypothetical protein FRC18_008554 [Serendipita sp. 400]
MNIVQPLSRSKSPTGNRSLHTIDESHLQSLSVDMEGGDYLELENIFGDGSVPIDLELDDLGWGLPQTAPSGGDTTFDKPNELTNVLEDYPMDDFVNMEPPVQEGPQSPVNAAPKQTPERAPFRASNNEGSDCQHNGSQLIYSSRQELARAAGVAANIGITNGPSKHSFVFRCDRASGILPTGKYLLGVF